MASFCGRQPNGVMVMWLVYAVVRELGATNVSLKSTAALESMCERDQMLCHC